MSTSSVPTLTKEQSVIISAYTGFVTCSFADFHEAVEKKLGHSVFVHQFGKKEFMESVSDAFREDFINICYKGDLQ